MIVHFINGPWHGKTEAISGNSTDRIMVPVAVSVSYGAAKFADPYGPTYATHEYKVTRRSRYAIAEYIEPKVDIHVAVEVGYDIYAYDDEMSLSRLFCGAGPVGNGVTQSAARIGRDALEISFDVRVDGPPDGLAVADATTKVNAYVQRKMTGVSSAAIKSVAASS